MMTPFIIFILIIIPTVRGVASKTTKTSWILNDDYPSQELKKMAADEKTARLAFNLLEAKNQYLALKKDKEKLTNQNKVLGKKLEFYECCCSTILFAVTLEKVSNIYWHRGFSQKNKIGPQTSERYKNCLNFLNNGAIEGLPKPDQETKWKAEAFRDGLRRSLTKYSTKKGISLDTGIQEFCFSQRKCYEIRDTVIHELDFQMKALYNLRKRFGMPAELSKRKCIPYSTETNLILNKTDLIFVNIAAHLIPFDVTPLVFVLEPINNYGHKAVITDSCKNNNYF